MYSLRADCSFIHILESGNSRLVGICWARTVPTRYFFFHVTFRSGRCHRWNSIQCARIKHSIAITLCNPTTSRYSNNVFSINIKICRNWQAPISMTSFNLLYIADNLILTQREEYLHGLRLVSRNIIQRVLASSRRFLHDRRLCDSDDMGVGTLYHLYRDIPSEYVFISRISTRFISEMVSQEASLPSP